jgi:hypothetical protein
MPIVPELARQRRTRANEAHIAAKHVDELGKFIDA